MYLLVKSLCKAYIVINVYMKFVSVLGGYQANKVEVEVSSKLLQGSAFDTINKLKLKLKHSENIQ